MQVADMASEDVCADFRRQAALLEQLSFETAEEKVSILEQLKARGLSRAQAHSRSDAAINRIRGVVAAWAALAPQLSDDDRRSINLTMMKQLQRLQTSFAA